MPLRGMAETLPEALASAREFNPTVAAARARAFATGETIPQARAGFLPKLSANADGNLQTDARHPSLAADRSTRAGGYDVTVSQPLFDGGRASSNLAVAKANANAEQEAVRSSRS
jgi:outer membrane protein